MADVPVAPAASRAADAPAVARPDARLRRFLEREAVLWLTTTAFDGSPHLVPVWFLWDGEAILVYSKPHAAKVRAMRANPRVMLALGDAEEDFDVGLIEGRAELLAAPLALPTAFLAKYRARMPRGRLDPATFAATYTQAIRIVPTRFLPWHGRGFGAADELATPAGARARGVRGWLEAGTTALTRWLKPSGARAAQPAGA